MRAVRTGEIDEIELGVEDWLPRYTGGAGGAGSATAAGGVYSVTSSTLSDGYRSVSVTASGELLREVVPSAFHAPAAPNRTVLQLGHQRTRSSRWDST